MERANGMTPGRATRSHTIGGFSLLGIAALVGAILLAACSAEDQPVAGRARVYATQRGQVLTPPSRSAPAAIISRFLRSQGVPGRAADHLRIVRENHVPSEGLTHLRLQQEVDGLRVVGAYVKATVTDRGELVHVIENLAAIPPRGLPVPQITERDALHAAAAFLGYVLPTPPAEVARRGNTVTFDAGSMFHAGPTVERVAFAGPGGLESGFLVETWSATGNLLHHTLVDAAGRVVSVELRTQNDRYKVFLEDPGKEGGVQTVVYGPGSGNAESPAGWLGSSTQLSTYISGNNASAYLDVDKNNRPDRGGTPVTNGDFLATVDLTQSPSIAANQEVAVQNLFYLNNVIHDILYAVGFTEAAGNFQEDNFGKGGSGSDAVLAEAQDGSGTDNANFATPGDGRNPRMQMFLWTGVGPDAEVFVNTAGPYAGSYGAKVAQFGAKPTATGVTGDIVLVNDGSTGADGLGSVTDGCETPSASLTGKVALVDRGYCKFTVKVANAQSRGAIAVIVANNVGTNESFSMGGTDRKIRIPAVMVGKADGATLRAAALNATVRAHPNPPLMIDASLDKDIVCHEYGHGLTWRMIGGMSGKLAGAVGEGASDVLAFLINGDDRIGEYSSSNPNGIRRAPYTNYPRTYADVTGAEVHDDGEVYAAAMWRLKELFNAADLSDGLLLAYFVQGMNYTPSTPAFEDMRDGMLQAVAADPSATDAEKDARQCLIWQAFAQFGIGVGASGVETSSGVSITESMTVPASCL